MVDSYEPISDSWTHNLSYTVTSGELGMYSFNISANYIDNTGDGWVDFPDVQFRSKIHWPFDPPLFGSGDVWKGVAPDAHLVGVKVLNQYGYGSASDIIDGINWVISNRTVYNITTMSLSLGGGPGFVAMIDAVNNAVENGIVTVVAAGNGGPGSNWIGSPGDADNVITVVASNVHDNITSYSSQGGSSYTGNTIKPDITAPGGSFFDLQMFSADTNDNDSYGEYTPDWYEDDLFGAQGTSMSTPAVAGAANLLIEAMGGHESWGYTGLEAKSVKSLLLMSATETYPLQREYFGEPYSPELNRGGKDIHEGYGRLNIDIAIEAYTQVLSLGSQKNAWITSSSNNSFNKHGFGCYINLNSGEDYLFSLDVPVGADFDLYLYSDDPTLIGEPQMVASSTSPVEGTDEFIFYTATETGNYYLIAKAISGEGNAIISYPILAHDLHVSLEVPTSPDVGNTYIVNATVTNTGNNIEPSVDLFLYLDGIEVNSTSSFSLPVDASKTINYTWIPTEYKTYNFTANSPPVPSETFLLNNNITKMVLIREVTLFDGMFIEYIWTISGFSMPEEFIYSSVSEDIFHVDWYLNSTFHMYWDVNTETRIMENSGGDGFQFGSGVHTPMWIFNDVSLGDKILIAVDAEGDHLFEVTSESTIDLPYFGTREVWVLEDLTFPGGNVWYEKETGILVNATFFWAIGGFYNYTFEFVFTNALGFDHDLSVSLEVPEYPEIGETYIINATVTNTGNNTESNVDLFLYLDGIEVNSTPISTLPIDASETINYTWTPTEYEKYNFTVYASPVPSEIYTENNIATEFIYIGKICFFEDFESGLSKWEEITGLWHLTDDTSIWPDPYYSPTHSMWFGNETTGNYQSNQREMGDLVSDWIILPAAEEIILEFYHWRESEFGWDISEVFISTNGIDWDFLYYSYDTISPWQKVSLNISDYRGYVVKLRFFFDTEDSVFNDYRGWLIDDIRIYAIGIFDHDLSVYLEVPTNPVINNAYIVNATVVNTGNNTETDVDLLLYLDDVVVNSTNIFSLPVNASKSINFTWTPTEVRTYNFSAYVPPISGETLFLNNIATVLITLVPPDDNYEENDFPFSAYDLSSYETTWLSTIDGLGVQLDNDWYEIYVDLDSENLFVNCTFTHAEGDINIDVLDASYNFIAGSSSATDNEYIDVPSISPGTYYIIVYGDNSGNEYDLWWDDFKTAPKTDDNYEENDFYFSAYSLSSHENEWLSTIDGIGVQFDEDWYEILIAPGYENVKIILTFTHSAGDIELALHDSTGTLIVSNRSKTDNEQLDYTVSSSGTYYIRLYGENFGNDYDLIWSSIKRKGGETRIPGYNLYFLLGIIITVPIISIRILLKRKPTDQEKF